jgi:4-carboxymuconolactone decarboxylase
MIIATYEETLRRLVLHDVGCIQSMLGIHLNTSQAAQLDPKTQALVRLGGLVATMGAAPGSCHWAAEAALDSGATAEDVVGTLIAVAPICGLARVISAAPRSPWRWATTSTKRSRHSTGTSAGDSGGRCRSARRRLAMLGVWSARSRPGAGPWRPVGR